MAGIGDLLSMMMQGAVSPAATERLGNALGGQGQGTAGGMLEQMFGRSGSGRGGLFGGLADAAKDMMGGAQSSLGSNPLATGGLGALVGSLLGGGGDALKGAMGGGAMAILAGIAFQAFKNANREPGAGEPRRGATQLPLGMRTPADEREERELESTANLVLKGMINAAKSDGQIDSSEMQKIVGRLKEAGANADEQRMLLEELSRPLDLDGLVEAIPSQTVAAQVYAGSLFVIAVDTAAERDYLTQLAQRTGLDPVVVQQLHAAVGIA